MTLSFSGMKSRSFKHHFKFLCVTLLALLLLACGGSKGEEQARRYQLKGTIISVDKPHKQVVIAHEAIAGLMEAMTMPYTLKDESAFDVMRPGDKIRLRYRVLIHPAATSVEPYFKQWAAQK